MATNANFTSPLANAVPSAGAFAPQIESVVDAVLNAGIITWVVSLVALAVAYDQSMYLPAFLPETPVRQRTLANKFCSIVSYLLQKGSIVGPAFKEPFIGPFLQSLDPKFEEYMEKWQSGPLSCVSVFHK